jgi:hypothetical protein
MRTRDQTLGTLLVYRLVEEESVASPKCRMCKGQSIPEGATAILARESPVYHHVRKLKRRGNQRPQQIGSFGLRIIRDPDQV